MKQKNTTTLLNTTANTTVHHGQHHPPMPPTKAMGAITKNRRGNLTANTMIDVVVLGCGPIRTGEGAAAPLIGVHILGEIRPAGGFDSLAESRWED